jgi:L-alanine-DL-glutamate epimerase-like enolase superfamily enzyme
MPLPGGTYARGGAPDSTPIGDRRSCIRRAAVLGMCSMYHVDIAPHHDPQIHGHLVAASPNGLTVESFHNPDRDPLWPDLYAESGRLEGGHRYLSERPDLGISFHDDFLRKYRQN